jgi:hypothetical protein
MGTELRYFCLIGIVRSVRPSDFEDEQRYFSGVMMRNFSTRKGIGKEILFFPPRNKKAAQRKEKGVLKLWQAYGLIRDQPAREAIARALTRAAALRH